MKKMMVSEYNVVLMCCVEDGAYGVGSPVNFYVLFPNNYINIEPRI